MAIPVIMPRQGQSVESCIIAKWYKAKGDKVKAGDILFTYETDKATFDEEAKVDGTILDIFFEEGDDVPVLTNACVIGNEGESTAEFNPKGQGGSVVSTSAVNTSRAAAVLKVDETAADPAAVNDSERIRISPRAKNLAEKTGVDFRFASPTGPNGRIIERDIITLRETGPAATYSAKSEYMKMDAGQAVEGTGLGGRITTGDLMNASAAKGVLAADMPVASAAEGLSAAAMDRAVSAAQFRNRPEFEEVKLTNIRKVIAKAMHHSISSTCQLTLNSSFDAADILAFRKKIKDSKDRFVLENITLNDIILYAVSRTLLNHKDMNAHFLDDKMLYFRNVNLGVAVDTDRGLMVPTIFSANLKSLNEISAEVKRLVQGCQKGTISPDSLKGGTFTITNLGTLDIESFTPVLNPPQTGILGVCNIVQRAKEVDGELVYYPAMGLSLTFDHRALDGAPAARFLQELKNNLENFSVLLVK